MLVAMIRRGTVVLPNEREGLRRDRRSPKGAQMTEDVRMVEIAALVVRIPKLIAA
jgi:hypothetical protein